MHYGIDKSIFTCRQHVHSWTCPFADGSVEYKLPSQIAVSQDPLIQEVIGSEHLLRHLNLSYLHPSLQSALPPSLVSALGVHRLRAADVVAVSCAMAKELISSDGNLSGSVRFPFSLCDPGRKWWNAETVSTMKPEPIYCVLNVTEDILNSIFICRQRFEIKSSENFVLMEFGAPVICQCVVKKVIHTARMKLASQVLDRKMKIL